MKVRKSEMQFMYMKKKISKIPRFALLCGILVILLTACGNKKAEVVTSDATKKPVEETSIKESDQPTTGEDASIDKSNSIIEDESITEDASLVDPIPIESQLLVLDEELEAELTRFIYIEDQAKREFEVLYPASMNLQNNETRELIQYFVDESDYKSNQIVDDPHIMMVSVDDFDGNGSYEAFIFTGKPGYEFDPIQGQLWYTDGTIIQKLGEEDRNEYWAINGFMDYGKNKYFCIYDYYVTARVGQVWGVVDEKPEKIDISGIGDIYAEENGDLVITISMYDRTLEIENGLEMALGHTWKPYYFYYDQEKECFVEYGGKLIRKDQIDKEAGFSLVEEMEAAGYPITTAYIRENGILNVNYELVEESEDVISYTYGNINYDCKNKCYLKAFDESDTSMSNSDFGGIYEAVSGPCHEVTYPK